MEERCVGNLSRFDMVAPGVPLFPDLSRGEGGVPL